MNRPPPPGTVFGMPAVLGVLTLAGLVAGLLGDGWYDLVSALAVAGAVAAIPWSLNRARRGLWDR